MKYEEIIVIAAIVAIFLLGVFVQKSWGIFSVYQESGTYFSSPTTAYFNVNYTKQAESTNLSLWVVKFTNSIGTYIKNLTIPQSCWNQNILQFRMTGRYFQCYDGIVYLNLLDAGYNNPSGAASMGWEQLIDGNWNTGACLHGGGFWVQSCGGNYVEFYEEAMIWDIPAICNTPADINCDSIVDRTELGVYINSWINNQATRDELGQAIVAWIG